MSIVCGPKWSYYSCDWIYWIYCTVWDRYVQVLYLGRALRTKETLPDFREKCRVTRHSQVFRGLTDSQRTPGFGASQLGIRALYEYLGSSGLGIHHHKVWFDYKCRYEIT